MTNHLPLDVARCLGSPAGPQGLHVREECQRCERRTAPRYKDIHSFMAPATQFPCEFRIPPERMGS